MIAAWTIIAVAAASALFVLGSFVHVYAYRGQLRWESVTEYIRKGWPIFSPLNCLLYAFTQKRGKPPIMDFEQFPELHEIRANWQTIREEAIELKKNGYFDQVKDPEAGSYYDLGFRTFFKYGWSKFYLTWYGSTHKSAQELCPKTVEIVKRCKAVNGAMFSLLPAGSKLTRHLDPVACSLRLHLGLQTPNDDKAYINVDSQIYSWRDGQALLFDETFLHHAVNETDQDRLILMCDVKRPTFIVGTIVNFFTKIALRASVVPNLKGDKCGLVNRIFFTMGPLLGKLKALKKRNKFLYKIIKYIVNLTLALIALSILAGVGYGAWALISWISAQIAPAG